MKQFLKRFLKWIKWSVIIFTVLILTLLFFLLNGHRTIGLTLGAILGTDATVPTKSIAEDIEYLVPAVDQGWREHHVLVEQAQSPQVTTKVVRVPLAHVGVPGLYDDWEITYETKCLAIGDPPALYTTWYVDLRFDMDSKTKSFFLSQCEADGCMGMDSIVSASQWAQENGLFRTFKTRIRSDMYLVSPVIRCDNPVGPPSKVE